MKKDENPTVYTTTSGRICPSCGRPQSSCVCKKKVNSAPAGDGLIRITREKKGRQGKTVTLVKGLPLGENALRELLSDLKRLCGGGGAVKDGALEIQGDHRETILAALKKRGFNPKLAGG